MYKIEFSKQKVHKTLQLILHESVGGDIPTISEVEFIKENIQDDNYELIRAINSCPAGQVENIEQHKILSEYYVKSGMRVCINEENFLLIPDGKSRSYTVKMPPLSGAKINTEISCNPYPFEYEIERMVINPFGQQ